MIGLLQGKRQAVAELCEQLGVVRLEVFGSAADGTFTPGRSDVDLLVEFKPIDDADAFHQYFGLHEALERLLGCKVDLVMTGAMKNPYFIQSVNQSREVVYAA
jgi:predicted nucleotidyltransferase